MSVIPFIGFALVAAVAVAFVAGPLFGIESKKTRALVLGLCALVIIAVGGGTYYFLGRPHLAQREASGLKTREVSGLVPFLIQRVRQYPNDARAWRYLAQAYMEAQDPRDGAKAFAKVVELTGQGDSVEVADSQADTTSKRSVEVATSAQMDKKAEIADSQQSDSTTSDRSLEMADSKQTDITPEQEGTNGEVEDTKKKNTTLDQQVSSSSSTIIKSKFF